MHAAPPRAVSASYQTNTGPIPLLPPLPPAPARVYRGRDHTRFFSFQFIYLVLQALLRATPRAESPYMVMKIAGKLSPFISNEMALRSASAFS